MPAQATDQIQCPKCKQSNEAGETFCGYCGTPLPQPAPVPAKTPAPIAAPEPARPTTARQQTVTPSAGGGPQREMAQRETPLREGLQFEDQLSSSLGDRDSLARRTLACGAVGMFMVALVAGWVENPFYLLGVLVFFSAASFPFITVLMTGRWPLARLFGMILGPERSLQRSLVMTLAFSFPFLLMVYGWNGMSVAFGVRALVILGIMFYLTGYAATWRPLDESSRVVANFGVAADPLFQIIRMLFEQQKMRPLHVTTRQVLEDTSFALSKEDAARRTVRLLEVTQDRARVVVRSLDYGGHLYVRWDVFAEYSGIRFVLVWKAFLSILGGIFTRFTGQNASVWVSEVSDILFGARASTGGKTIETGVGGAEYVPSWVFDNVIELGQLANRLIIHEALNPALERASRPERLNVPETGGRRRIL